MKADIEKLIDLMSSFDWNDAFYDPLHDRIEAVENSELSDLKRMEECISRLQELHSRDRYGKIIAEVLVEQFWARRPMEHQIPSLFKKYSGKYQAHEHSIDDEIIPLIRENLSHNNNWIAYNSPSYFIDKDEIFFFKSRDEAFEFQYNNVSEWDDFNVIHVNSQMDFLLQVGYGDYLKEELELLANKKLSIMNQENFDYLKDNVKYMGFGEKLNESLELKLKEGKPEFQLTTDAKFNNKVFEANLNFRKSDNSDMYFFNSYNASLTRTNGDKVDQTFYMNKGKGVTAKEAYNMLEGRAVHKELNTKEGESYKAWLQLDFKAKDKNNNHEVKQYHENYGYDLKAALGKYAITELADVEKEKTLLQSLQKGNIQSVSIEKDGNVSKMFVEANPQYKTVTLYDAQMKRVQKEDLSQYQLVQQSNGKENKQEQKEELKPDKKKDIKQKTVDEIDGSKKKTSRKKGLSI